MLAGGTGNMDARKKGTPSGLEAYAHMPDGKMHRKQRLILKTPTFEYKWQWKHKLH